MTSTRLGRHALIQRRSWLRGLVLLVLLLPPVPAPADVLHVYDRLNRLRATVDPAANDSSIWVYDAVGNIQSITRQPATQTTILEIPANAVAGTCGVRILGIGFNPTAGQNTVTINGVTATVQSATATELVVCVGAGTTTGSVVVTTPTGPDTSDGPLAVQAAAAVPTITGFTPGVAVWGTALSVTGTNFDVGPGRTRLRVGATSLLAPVSSVTATSAGTTVSPGATSGRLTLTTPAGSATAPSDLFVPPAPYVASDVAVTGRWTLGTSQAVTIPALTQGLFVFDAAVGQKVCVGTNFTSGAGNIVKAVFQPTGLSLFPPYSGGDSVIEMSPLPMAGTYQVQLRNASGASASVGHPIQSGLPGREPDPAGWRAGPLRADQSGLRRDRRDLRPHRNALGVVRPGPPVRDRSLGADAPGRPGLRVRADLGQPPGHPGSLRQLGPHHDWRRAGEPEPDRGVERALARLHLPRRGGQQDHPDPR